MRFVSELYKIKRDSNSNKKFVFRYNHEIKKDKASNRVVCNVDFMKQ